MRIRYSRLLLEYHLVQYIQRSQTQNNTLRSSTGQDPTVPPLHKRTSRFRARKREHRGLESTLTTLLGLTFCYSAIQKARTSMSGKKRKAENGATGTKRLKVSCIIRVVSDTIATVEHGSS